MGAQLITDKIIELTNGDIHTNILKLFKKYMKQVKSNEGALEYTIANKKYEKAKKRMITQGFANKGGDTQTWLVSLLNTDPTKRLKPMDVLKNKYFTDPLLQIKISSISGKKEAKSKDPPKIAEQFDKVLEEEDE